MGVVGGGGGGGKKKEEEGGETEKEREERWGELSCTCIRRLPLVFTRLARKALTALAHPGH